jgi:HAD superfamily hydrolase (TIGR01549 family)
VIKAVFFDWYYTLAYGQPSREDLYCSALRQAGFEIDRAAVMRGAFAADSIILKKNLLHQLIRGSEAEKARIGSYYPRLIFKEAGLEATDETISKVFRIMLREYQEPAFRLFDDVLPTLKVLKGRGLTLGLVTNASNNMLATYGEMGLEPYLDLVANSEEAGAEKPKPPIFLLALEKAGVSASESIHVGDQYELDILGARDAGIAPILIDRYDLYSEIEFRPRIKSLAELPDYL